MGVAARVKDVLRNRLTVAMSRSRVVDRPLAFVAGELRRRPSGPTVYRLRHGGQAFALRHGTRDADILHEVLLHDQYAPPAEALAVLPPAPASWTSARTSGSSASRSCAGSPTPRSPRSSPTPLTRRSRRTIELNGAQDQWVLVEAAAMPEDGPVAFVGGKEALSHVAFEGEGTMTVEGRDVFPYLERTDLLKMDIEAGEWALLRDPRFAQTAVPALVLEYHPMADREADAHAYVDRFLRGMGYTTRPVFRHPTEQIGVTWAWRA